jgi:hypothetical protein
MVGLGTQGGFRVHRGTIETIASLNETILQFGRGRNKIDMNK